MTEIDPEESLIPASFAARLVLTVAPSALAALVFVALRLLRG